MLSKRERYSKRVNNRYFERQSLIRQTPYEDIPPYIYQRPTTVPLGITTEPPSEYDINKSTIEIRKAQPNYDEIKEATSSDETSDDSISDCTIRLYNRLEGRWELPEPQPYHPQAVFDQYYQEEDARLNTEHHQVHNEYERNSYVEYHRLQVYNYDSSDSSFNTSNINDTESDTTDISYDSTDSNNTYTSECTPITWLSRRRLYWPDHNYNTGPGIDFEIDSTGDFPISYCTTSITTTTSPSQNRSAGYATQPEEDNNHYGPGDRNIYIPRPPDIYDDGIDPVTGRYNSAYWRHVQLTSGDLPTRVQPTTNSNITVPGTQTTSTTTRVTTTETGTRPTNPLPSLGSRYYLPIRAARKSVNPVYAVPRNEPRYKRLSSSKQTARKSTVTQKVRTVHRTVAAAPDTTTSAVPPKKKVPKRKRNSGKDTSDTDSSGIPYMPRFKRDPNA